jgi:CheY-like chemotaxis protein
MVRRTRSRIPVSESQSVTDIKQTDPSMQQDARNRPVVLVVEDEQLLRWNAVAIIEDAGFDVVDAANAAEAIAILERRNDIRIIFTDIQMPGSIDGLRLAHLVKTRWPPIKIIMTSGHLRVREDELPEGGWFLPKPYSQADVAGVLRELQNGS